VSDEADQGPSRTVLFIAAGLVLLLVAGVVVAKMLLDDGTDQQAAPHGAAPRTDPLALVPVDAPAGMSPECSTLTGALPATLTSGNTTLKQLRIADPAPAGALAWAGARGEPLVLRCGLSRPAELVVDSKLRQVNGVRWLPVAGTGAATWFAVDRPVYLAVTVPDDAGTGPLQEISEVAARVLPPTPVDPNR